MNWQALAVVAAVIISMLGYLFSEVNNIRILQQKTAAQDVRIDANFTAIADVWKLTQEIYDKATTIEGNLKTLEDTERRLLTEYLGQRDSYAALQSRISRMEGAREAAKESARAITPYQPTKQLPIGLQVREGVYK